jgi:NAD(P)-dependent dehydrogenase (short-subunit alcohol dehydrogenase family)
MNRRVLITAGANGIGLVMARAFAALGDRVWVTDVDAAAKGMTPDALRQGYAAGTALKRLTDPRDVADIWRSTSPPMARAWSQDRRWRWTA